MTYLNIQIALGGRVTRVTALGRTGEDRSQALEFIRYIEPELKSMDLKAKSSVRKADK